MLSSSNLYWEHSSCKFEIFYSRTDFSIWCPPGRVLQPSCEVRRGPIPWHRLRRHRPARGRWDALGNGQRQGRFRKTRSLDRHGNAVLSHSRRSGAKGQVVQTEAPGHHWQEERSRWRQRDQIWSLPWSWDHGWRWPKLLDQSRILVRPFQDDGLYWDNAVL